MNVEYKLVLLVCINVIFFLISLFDILTMLLWVFIVWYVMI